MDPIASKGIPGRGSIHRCTSLKSEARLQISSLGSQVDEIFYLTSTTGKDGPGYEIFIHAPKYALATLIQGVAVAFPHQLLEQGTHCFYPIHQRIQFRKLSL